MKYTTTLLCALLGALSASAFAAQTLTLSLDAASAEPGKFAAEEIRREAAVRGMTVASAEAKTPADTIRIVLAVGAPSGTKAAAQSYGIRVQREKDLPITITVTGGDAAGAMYGGLDIAEVVRNGALGQCMRKLRPTDAERSSFSPDPGHTVTSPRAVQTEGSGIPTAQKSRLTTPDGP